MTPAAKPRAMKPRELRDRVGLIAAIDAMLEKLALDGLIPPHQPCSGEEAALVGAAAALKPTDWAFWGRQVAAPAILRGLPLTRLFSHALRSDAAAEIAAQRVVVCSQGPAARLPHAAGVAWAQRHQGVVALAELGDGAVSDADFHVGLNFAAVMDAPVVFVVRSDGSIPVAERAEGYGIPGQVVSGEDPVAVRDAVAGFAARARKGKGPALLEVRVVRGQRPTGWARHEQTVDEALASAQRG